MLDFTPFTPPDSQSSRLLAVELTEGRHEVSLLDCLRGKGSGVGGVS